MNTDCAFYIGTTHEVCQDYALAGEKHIVVSDGCSGSKYSDIGSRILSIIAMNKMPKVHGNLSNFNPQECVWSALPLVKMIDMSQECLDATLLGATFYPGMDELFAMCHGDGTIAIRTQEEETIILDCAYTDSYPFYMNYLCDIPSRFINWKDNYNNREITQTVIGADGNIVSSSVIDASCRLFSNLGMIELTDYSFSLAVCDAKNLIKYVAIMSDGVHSFYETVETETNRYNQSVPYLDVLKELLSFKNFNKAFVQRRMNKFRKDCVKKNWGNADDLSLAVIYTGE